VFRADEWPADRVEAALDDAIEKAGKGVLFLDEISTWSKPLQAALMHRLGDLKARLFSASSHELAAVREDLFYALAVLQVTLPPLTERTSDIPRWPRHFSMIACSLPRPWPRSKHTFGRAMCVS
jgi:DNA-binding NtrC family response regulator